jgi:hypothetical protein
VCFIVCLSQTIFQFSAILCKGFLFSWNKHCLQTILELEVSIVDACAVLIAGLICLYCITLRALSHILPLAFVFMPLTFYLYVISGLVAWSLGSMLGIRTTIWWLKRSHIRHINSCDSNRQCSLAIAATWTHCSWITVWVSEQKRTGLLCCQSRDKRVEIPVTAVRQLVERFECGIWIACFHVSIMLLTYCIRKRKIL